MAEEFGGPQESDTDFGELVGFDAAESPEPDTSEPQGDTPTEAQVPQAAEPQPVASPPTTEPQPQAPVQPEVVVSETTPQEAPPPSTTVSEPTTPEPVVSVQQEPVAPQPQQPVAPTQEQLVAEQQKQAEQWETLLVDHYKISEEEAGELLEDPMKAYPKQLARVHMAVANQVSNFLVAQVPNMIQQQVTQREQATKDGDAFFESWPQLRDEKYHETLHRVGMIYRQMNPQASAEQFIREVGAQVSVMLGLGAQAPQQQQPAVPQGQPMPAQVVQHPAQGTPAVQQPPGYALPPYQPAQSDGGVVSPSGAAPQGETDNIFAEMYEQSLKTGW